ncbi:MAG: ECF-type sigma factor [Planctomycetota bacterium]|nr:ECF-type sigma factor [Planctomycetota bacterium]
MSDPGHTTRLLRRLTDGDAKAADELFTLVYEELHSVAERLMAGERSDHTLQATALIHEAWMRLLGGAAVSATDRTHFLRLAARAMRHVLVDHARGRGRAKRGGGVKPLPLDEAVAHFEQNDTDLLALDEALEKLAAQDEQLARIVELRCFGGLTLEETGEVMGLTVRKVHMGWTFARGWLRGELEKGG